MTPTSRKNHREVGAALVEFAILLPLLLMLVFGIVEFGRGYNNQVTLTHAAREGVRDYAINHDQGQAIAIATAAAASGVRTENLTFSFDDCNAGETASMRIDYPFQLLIPFVPSSPITLSGTGVMRCGG